MNGAWRLHRRSFPTCAEGYGNALTHFRAAHGFRLITPKEFDAFQSLVEAVQDCLPCPVRSQCTKAKQRPREVNRLPQRAEQALREARQYQQTADFRVAYRRRAGVESLIAQGIRACGLRRTRFMGATKTHLHHVLIAVTINSVRFVAWVRADTGTYPPQRKSAFARFATRT